MHCFYKAKAAISADPVPDPSVAMSNLAEHSKLSRASLMRVAKVGCLMNTEPSTATSSSALSRFLQMAFTPEIPTSIYINIILNCVQISKEIENNLKT